jgi:prespore-specific regulator
MTTVRQDAWTKDEDLLLAEVVLRHIREGGTQLKAFEEVGQKLSRTPAACGFRWNSFVRKQYKTGIELAKNQRKELKKKNQEILDDNQQIEEISSEFNVNYEPDNLSFDQIISFLQEFKEKERQIVTSNYELKNIKDRYIELETKVQNIIEENELLRKENKSLKDDYLALLSIMEKARKLAVKEDENSIRMKFQMDTNGNLDVIKK